MDVGSYQQASPGLERLRSRGASPAMDHRGFRPLSLGVGDEGGLLAAFDTILRQSESLPALSSPLPSESSVENSSSNDTQEVSQTTSQSSGEEQTSQAELQYPVVESVLESDLTAEMASGAEEPIAEPVGDSASPVNESQVLPADNEHDNEEGLVVSNEAALATASRLIQPPPEVGQHWQPDDSTAESQPVDGAINPAAEEGERPRTRQREKNEVPATQFNLAAKQVALDESANEPPLRAADDETLVADGSDPVDTESNSRRRTRRGDRLAEASGRRGMGEAVSSQNQTEQKAASGTGERSMSAGESQAGFMEELLQQMERVDNGTFSGGQATSPGNGPLPNVGETMGTAVVVDRSALLGLAGGGGAIAGTGGTQADTNGAKVDASSSVSNGGERTEKSAARVLERGTGTSSGDGSATTSNEQRVRLVQRVARAFQRIGPGGGQVHMMLHPAELGSVRLAMSITGSHVQALLTAESPAAENVLREHLPELRQRLADSGLVVDRMEVQSEQRESARDPSRGRDDRDGLSQFGQNHERHGNGERRAGERAVTGWERGVRQEVRGNSGVEEPVNSRSGVLGRMGKEGWLRASLDVHA